MSERDDGIYLLVVGARYLYHSTIYTIYKNYRKARTTGY
jgi:hypothetical protein